ncbi:thiF family protein [Sarocladium implicatum]|nr:thiF family protein [Sarocladium implicatum]
MTDIMAQTPPLLHDKVPAASAAAGISGPSDKERKYDRQLRLWAASGQAALESANVLLVNSGCGTVGVETLKNLVLPGIGKFTIFDDTIVSDADLGVNFFLDLESRGQSRAKCCTDLLLELNPEVQGNWFPKSNDNTNLKSLLDTSSPFTIILYTLPLSASLVQVIEDYASQHAIPLFCVHSAGFYSYFQLRLPGTFPIVDTHPDDTATTDLRLLSPWPALSSFARTMTSNIDALNDHDHGHLPLVVILLHYLEEWKASHDGKLPTSYADKTAFRKLVSDVSRRDNPEGGEENFEEAAAAVMKHITVPSLPSSLREVFDYQTQNPEELKSSFWIIAEAVKRFHQKHGGLPVAGGLPDMKAQSSVYIQLQNLYKDKAREDAAEVLATVRDTTGGENIDPAEVEQFCTNARFIKLIRDASGASTPLNEVVERELGNDEIAAIAGPEMPTTLIPIYLALTATSQNAKATTDDILSSISQRAPTASANDRVQRAAEEVSRAAGGELHNVSAVMGGMVAQEMIKIVTKQYIPVDNTCIFDGIESRCQVLRL